MNQFARRIGGLAGPIAALVAVALTPASASATPSNSVSISGPRSVQIGAKVRLRFTGYAASGVPSLRVWLDNRRCATTARTEGGRAEVRAPTNFAVSGKFKAVLTIAQSSAGTHVVCAYLVARGTQSTAARASWRYDTH
jgi:hypothetical protein